jgi:hypothetical protein
MRLERSATAGVLICIAGALCGCQWPGSLRSRAHPAPVPATVVSHESEVIADYLNTLAALSTASNSEQSEIVAAAKAAASVESTISARLKYALILGLPGHSASDAVAGRKALLELLAVPEQLLPQERALVSIMLANLDAVTAREAETQNLRDRRGRLERERIAALNRRVQGLTEENEQIRKDLADARAKLDAIATLERDMSDRRPVPTGAKP